jgi:predicted GTPase
MKELEDTINATPCDAVVIGTPIDLRQALRLNKPAVRVQYELQEVGKPNLEDALRSHFSKDQVFTK